MKTLTSLSSYCDNKTTSPNILLQYIYRKSTNESVLIDNYEFLDTCFAKAKFPRVAEPFSATAGVTIYSLTSGVGR